MTASHDARTETRLGTPPAAKRIERFLKDHPKGKLFVAVGYASAYGLAWLGKRTSGRSVTLLIGNAQPSRFEQASAATRAEALDFLHRHDVEVKNWYRTERAGKEASTAHLKVWAACHPRHPGDVVTAALVGSANLSDKGLHRNVEVCVEVAGKDLGDVMRQIKPLFKEAQDCRQRIIGYLERETSPVGKGHRELEGEASGNQPDTSSGGLVRAVTWPFRMIRTTASLLLKVLAVVGSVTVIGLVALLAVAIARGWFG